LAVTESPRNQANGSPTESSRNVQFAYTAYEKSATTPVVAADHRVQSAYTADEHNNNNNNNNNNNDREANIARKLATAQSDCDLCLQKDPRLAARYSNQTATQVQDDQIGRQVQFQSTRAPYIQSELAGVWGSSLAHPDPL
jgi:hypothetical protein